AGRGVPQVLQADGLERLGNGIRDLRRPSTEHGPYRSPGAGGDVEVLQDAELFEDAGGLEGPAHAESGDLVDLLADELDTGLLDRAARLHQTGDRVDDGGLAGAVRADQEPQVTLHQRQVHP